MLYLPHMSRGGFHDRAEAEGHQLYFTSWVDVAVAAVVFLLEIAQEIFRERDIELVSLAAVAEVDAAVVVRFSLPRFVAKISCGGIFQGGKFAIQLRGGNFAGDAPEDGAGIVLDDVAGENSESGQCARKRGDDDLRDAEGFGEGAGVQASGAAEGNEREVAGVAATLDRDNANGFLHGGVDDADHSGSEL